MEEPVIDLRDSRARLRRIVIAMAVGVTSSLLAIAGINRISPPANSDPVGGSAVGLLAIFIAVVVSLVALGVLTKLARR